MVAEQISIDGKRRFWAVPMSTMFAKLRVQPLISLYEVLDSAALCRLYFDVEYDRVANSERTAAQDASVVTLLLKHANGVLAAQGMTCDAASLWVLDSSDSSKLSQHIIVGVLEQGYVGHVSVVGKLAAQISHLAATDSPATFLIRKPGHANMVSLVDLSVYNTNQQFRVAFSSKFGQNRPLLPFNKQQAVGLSQCTWPMFESTLVVCGRTRHAAQAPAKPTHSALQLAQLKPALPACYLSLEAHINRQLLSGQLKKAKVHREHPLQVPCLYWSTTSRFCPAVGREHASNHMQIVVNVAYCTWRFHCLDPECKPGPWMSFSPSLLQLHPGAVHPGAGAVLKEWHEYWERKRVNGP